jgi:RHS repeat-associated protein
MNTNRFAKALVVTTVSIVLACPAGAPWAQSRPVTTFTYDANGNPTSTTDALGRVTSQTYDTLNRLTKITQPKPLASQPNPVTQFGINGLDRLTSVTDARSLVTSYTMTGLGDLTQQVSPDTGTTINTFDAAGNLKTSKDARGKTTTYTYDGINRLTQAKYGDGTITYYYYDEGANSVGHLTRMVDPGPVTTTWTYTPQGRVATKSQALTAGGATRTHTLQYAYNPTTGQLTSITYPSGRVIGLQYGVASKEVETVTVDGQPVASSVTYHPFGGIKRMNLRNGLVWSSTLDQDGRITSYTLGGATYSIQWDSANRIVAITHPTDANWSRGYAYDGLDRIASFISQPRDQTFNYDATGNLLSKMDRVGTTDPFTYTYTIAPTSNRMTGISNLGIGYTIDAAGNRTADSTTTWVVNARGRVSQVRVISGATTTTYNYLINGQNLRVRKTGPSSVVPQGTQVFVYDEAGRLIGEYDNYGRARNEHVWLADRPVALIVYTYSGTSTTPLTTTYYSVEADHLGTPRLVTDSSQAQRWTWHSAPYGDTQPNEKPGTPAALVYNLRFPGQYFDKETNNFYNWHRDYESTTGRYIQSDPIGLAGGINTFAYVNGNPLVAADPTGEFAFIPIAAGYARCMAQCMAIDAAGEWLTEGSLQCFDIGDVAGECAIDCLSPTNWFGPSKLKAVKNGGRSGKQQRLKELANDPNVSSADRGWIKNELRHIENGNRSSIRNPRNSRESPHTEGGTVLAHPRGERAADGHGYGKSVLQDSDLHKLEHKHEGYR